jgi:SAM-dependent methyltransferase
MPRITGLLERSKIAQRLCHVLPYRVRVEVEKRTYTSAPSLQQWAREVMNRDIEAFVESLDPRRLNVVEVSGKIRSAYPWASYTRLEYPKFDLCDPAPTHNGRYDLVICEQVLEHVENPVTAVGNLKALCAPGGMVLVSTPFLIRIHPHPNDFWRFTPDGLKKLLDCQGLRVEWVRSWGNRAAVRGNFRVWAPYRPWQSLRNEPDVPVVVWALARLAGASEA